MKNKPRSYTVEMTKKNAIVLGGTVPHKFLIENLKARGYRTLLIDYYVNPPAASVCDKHIQESTLNQDAVLKIAEQENTSLVISGCVDQANVTACYVAEKLGLPAPYDYKTALRVTDKTLMKEGLVRAGVATSEYKYVSSSEVNSFQCNDYPKVVKPCDCNGSKGVRKVRNADELRLALVEACNFSRTGRAIVENFNEGQEVNGYFFISEVEVYDLYIKGKKLPETDGHTSLQSFLTLGPEQINEKAKENFIQAVSKIAQEFSLRNTPILVQANINGDSVKIIEFAPRVGGGLSSREIALLTGFDIIDSVVSSYLGEPVDLSNIRKPDSMSAVVHLYGTGGTLKRVEGMEELIAEGIVEEFHMHKTPGMEMSCEDLASRNRVMGAIIRGRSLLDINARVRRMIAVLRFFSTDNTECLNRSLFTSNGNAFYKS
ncbi:Phosphoribosylglycinamide synthetase, ATP-grasp (A) domain [Desulfonatronospira thiodismutans ASO3-1]|uniref:Phosphoribosylglycinamide synthetase, ATP-grasp (A) domain n=2 Tax=Desulfonatronospira thiodismutans TaxID=488939 RepID=D6SU69_9BACT|nr:Phosphoribosylglycinamide synthetase, ATP-grasp (A) domain [Desulfonatronospira thiodismutans ASO3-1]